MDRLDNAISDINYILDCLVLLRQIQFTGDCNICKNKDCKYKPELGQTVRYNCPFYKAEIQKMQELEQAEIQKAYELGKAEQPKTGRWINIDATHSKCDRCGAVFEIVSANGEANYCPNCGAKIEVGE